jgi:hypothetical protein
MSLQSGIRTHVICNHCSKAWRRVQQNTALICSTETTCYISHAWHSTNQEFSFLSFFLFLFFSFLFMPGTVPIRNECCFTI